MATRWIRWSEHPFLQRSHALSAIGQLCDRIATLGTKHTTRLGFLAEALSDICLITGASSASVVRRGETWIVEAEHGVHASTRPTGLFEDALDKEAAGFTAEAGDSHGPCCVTPLGTPDRSLLVLGGGRLTDAVLSDALLLGRVVGTIVTQLSTLQRVDLRLERLKGILGVARVLSGVHDSQELLEKIAAEATRLLDCDRASIFLWDKEQKQLVACPALGVPGGKLWLPDNKGIVGEVIRSGKTVHIDDAYADPRFDQSVDKSSGYRTRNLLCIPLLNAAGQKIGAFELINKNRGGFADDDEEGLEQLGVQVAVAVENAQERDQLIRSNRQLTEQITGGSIIIGESPAITAMRGTIDRLAATDLPVLILGESGTGKEVASQSLHYRGPRNAHPFIAVNCAALTETLLESELFGHERGAFTDAHATHIGKFELAQGGTLFLDEIGDMSPGGQAKLLRVLEQKVITRVGGTQLIPVNVRVVAATNALLTELVREKKFRQDLYYRLSVVTVEIPPLRDRPEDIQPLAEYFLARFCRQANRRTLAMSAEARKRLQAHLWPGNVRELRNLMERVAFLSVGDKVESDDLAFILSPQKDTFSDLADGMGLAEATDKFQAEFIKRSVKRVQGNMTEAAKTLGLHRSNLYRKMRQLGMEVDESKV